MIPEQFDAALRAFCRRRPFRPFLIEFGGANQLLVTHPEAVRIRNELYVMRSSSTSGGGWVVFPAESVSRLLDPNIPTGQ